jgi:hypothetical protein
MGVAELFEVETPGTVSAVLQRFGVSRTTLAAMEHGLVLWHGNGYAVKVAMDADEFVSPVQVQIDLVSEGEPIRMAGATLASDLSVLSAEFAEGLPADEDDFSRYLAEAILSVDSLPQYLTDGHEDELAEPGDWADLLSGNFDEDEEQS